MHFADVNRYDGRMKYRRCGKSGVLLPEISLGLWKNFGNDKPFEVQKSIILRAFDLGITHFDLANNYGNPDNGLAEEHFGKILHDELPSCRDEMFISTKAGYTDWAGPYGNWGSRKYLMASLDRSLKRLGLPYVDLFYHHRPDPDTPLEETCGALSDIVKSGKALYVGISNYGEKEAAEALRILRSNGTPCLIEQPRYNLFERWEEDGLFRILKENGAGAIAYSPLAQGALTGKYLNGIPDGTRASDQKSTITGRYLDEPHLKMIRELNGMAEERGEKLSQMALAWILRREEVTSVLVGASSPEQLQENVKATTAAAFTEEELEKIDRITGKV